MSTPQPTKKERREAARAQREAAEQAEQAKKQRKQRLLVILGGVAAAAVIAVVLIATTSGGDSNKGASKQGGAVQGVGAAVAVVAEAESGCLGAAEPVVPGKPGVGGKAHQLGVAGGVVGHGRLLCLARGQSPARDRTIRAERGDEPS